MSDLDPRRHRSLDTQLDEWVAAALVTPEQAEQLRAYEAARRPAQPTRDGVTALFGVIGGVLVGLGVLLLVAANWSSISDGAKLGILITSMSIAYALGIAADARRAASWVGTTAYVIGLLTFAGGVFLIGQLYNVRAHDPLGFFVVALVGTALTIIVARRTLGVVSAAAWMAWGAHELVSSIGDADDEAIVVAILSAAVLLLIAALAASTAVEARARAARAGGLATPRAVLLGGVELVLAPMRWLSLSALLVLLTVASFAWHADDDLLDTLPVQVAVASIVAAAAIALLARTRAADHARSMALVLGACAAAALVVAFVQHALVIGLLANAVMVVIGGGLVLLGVATERSGVYAWGVVWLTVLTVARYFDALFAFDLGGFAFLGIGFLFIAIAWAISRSRRAWRDLTSEQSA